MQPPPVGVMLYVTVPGVVPEFRSVCAGIVAVPLGVKPVIPAVAVAVQLNVAPAMLEVSVTRELVWPEQIVCVRGEFVTSGTGLMVMAMQVLGLMPQVLDALTQRFPPVDPQVTDIELVPCPELMVDPEGTVHV